MRLLEVAFPERSQDELLGLSIGGRDALLLRIRENLFGTRLRSTADCPACGRRMEVSLLSEDIQSAAPTPGSLPQSIQYGSQTIAFRLPNAGDMVALSSLTPGPEPLKSLLSKRCIISVTQEDGKPLDGVVPDEVVEVVSQEIAARDTQANTELKVTCSECGHVWTALFDTVSFLWAELDALCRRLLHQVHQLASAYGWTEAEILGLSPARRGYYVSLIESGSF